jgi:hypothetical protein
MMAFPVELEKFLPQLVAQVWTDEDLYHRFISEPAAMLREAGMLFSDSVKIIVNLGDTSAPLFVSAEGGTVCEINLPPKPIDLTEEQMTLFNKPVNIPACCC